MSKPQGVFPLFASPLWALSFWNPGAALRMDSV